MWIGVILLWAGYAAGLWGYCLIRGYCVSPKDILDWRYPSAMGAPATKTGVAVAGGGA